MTETTKEASVTNASSAPATGAFALRAKVTATIGTLFDLGTAWAGTGLGYLKLAVENGARALDRTAKTLETYQERFKKDEAKPAA